MDTPARLTGFAISRVTINPLERVEQRRLTAEVYQLVRIKP